MMYYFALDSSNINITSDAAAKLERNIPIDVRVTTMLKLENHLSRIFHGCLLESLPLSFVYPRDLFRNPGTRDHVRGAINGAT